MARRRIIDAWGVDTAKCADAMAAKDKRGSPRAWVMRPITTLLPGHPWQEDERYKDLTQGMTGEAIEYAKSWVLNDDDKTAALWALYPFHKHRKRKGYNPAHRKACLLSQQLSVLRLRDYLTGLHFELRRRTDRAGITPDQIIQRMEQVWLDSSDKTKIFGWGRFLYGVKTGIWGSPKTQKRPGPGRPPKNEHSEESVQADDAVELDMEELLEALDKHSDSDTQPSQGQDD